MSDLFCHATVTRNFIEDACNEPAAGFAMPSGPDEVDPWPACSYHLNRWGAAPLWEALAAAWDEGFQAGDCRCGAWSRNECGCGLCGTGRIVTPNPYRAEGDPR